MEGSYNLRSPAVKRLMKEAQELKEPTEQFFAQPLEENLFEWHFTIRGPADSEFESGIYHGRIVLPPEYPMKPPSIILLTPNGRFEMNKKICLSISGHHPESWQPSWSLRTALLAIIGFMPTHGNGAIGSLDYTAEERKILAKKSQDWTCPHCGPVKDLVLPVTEASKALNKEAKELGSQINLQGEKEKSPAATSSQSDAQATDVSTTAGDPAAGAAGPVPSPETVPSFPIFPYPCDPRLMLNAARYQHPMGFNPFGATNPMMPMFVPPFFQNRMFNPFLIPQPPPGSFPSQGFPPGFWMGSGQYPPFGAMPGAGTQQPNPVNPPAWSPAGFSTGAGQTSTVSATSASNVVPNLASQPASTPLQTVAQNLSSLTPNSPSVEPTSLPSRPTTSEGNVLVSPRSGSSQSLPVPHPAAAAAANAEPVPAESDDPVPSASELRQRHVAREQRAAPIIQRTNQQAELPLHQNLLSSNIGRMLLNFLVTILVFCIIALLSRRLYLLG